MALLPAGDIAISTQPRILYMWKEQGRLYMATAILREKNTGEKKNSDIFDNSRLAP